MTKWKSPHSAAGWSCQHLHNLLLTNHSLCTNTTSACNWRKSPTVIQNYRMPLSGQDRKEIPQYSLQCRSSVNVFKLVIRYVRAPTVESNSLLHSSLQKQFQVSMVLLNFLIIFITFIRIYKFSAITKLKCHGWNTSLILNRAYWSLTRELEITKAFALSQPKQLRQYIQAATPKR